MSCSDGHSWASAWVVVESHGHVAITDRDGRFELPRVTPGTYTVTTWHERLGTRHGHVAVTTGRAASLRLTYDLD